MTRSLPPHWPGQLTRWNYEATYVQEFDHVMQEFEKAQPDLVLMDITLPYFSGYYWCAEIRKISGCPLYSSPPPPTR